MNPNSKRMFGRHQQIIVSYPPTKQLSSEEQDLVWKFRYYLTTQEKVGAFLLLSSHSLL